MKKAILIVCSIIFSICFIGLLYNIDVVMNLVERSFGKRPHVSIDPTQGSFYAISFISYALITWAFSRMFKLKFSFTYFGVVIPPILIDSTVLFGAQELAPLRFPYATIFPILGAILTITMLSTKDRRRKIFIGTSVVLLLLLSLLGLPQVIQYMEDRQTRAINFEVPKSFGMVKDPAGNTVSLDSLLGMRGTLIDYYFVGCSPCELKMRALHELKQQVDTSTTNIIMVCNGKITDFPSFQEHAALNTYKGIQFYYDFNGIKSQITKAENYPFEIIIDGDRKLVSSLLGYTNSNKSEYIKNTIKTINTLP